MSGLKLSKTKVWRKSKLPKLPLQPQMPTTKRELYNQERKLSLWSAMTVARSSGLSDKQKSTLRGRMCPSPSYVHLLIESQSQHENFSESTEEIAPLTEEEKKAKLEELRANLAEKRAKQAIIDKEEAKKNEVSTSFTQPSPLPLANASSLQKIRMKSTKEVADLKEQLAHKELQKAAAAKKAEKAADIAAKKRIQEKIAADKEARRLKAEEAKALREGRAAPESSAPAAPAPSTSATTASKPAANHTEARLRLQTAGGTVTKTFPAETTLLEVAMSVQAENGGAEVRSLTMTFPKKTWEGDVDFGLTLKEAGLMPSAVLIVK